jgi:GxxExxY protein
MTQTPAAELIRQVIDRAKEVHERMGPGFSNEVYEACLAIELAEADLPFESGRVLTATYEGQELDYRCETDLIVASTLLLQIEAAETIELAHEQKLRTCLWMGGYPSGLLLNFNVATMEDGIFHMAGNTAEEPTPFRDVFDDPDPGSAF